MTQQIPWNDGSGDKIYLTYSASSGSQTVAVSSDANGGFLDRTQAISFSYIGTGGSTLVQTLTVVQAAGSDLIVITRNDTCITYNDVGIGFALTIPEGYRRLKGVKFDGNVWYETNIKLKGSDTLRFSFLATKACNVLGCYSSADAQTNYSLYATTTSGGKYLRYNGGTYNSYISTNTRYDVVVTPTGSSGMRSDSTWTAKTFEAVSNMCIGTTSLGATSAKLTGDLYGDVIVDGRAYIIPLEKTADGSIVYYDAYSATIFTNLGSGTPVSLGYY